jgi:CubicO group peptidase (beta-lactamase class C family)
LDKDGELPYIVPMREKRAGKIVFILGWAAWLALGLSAGRQETKPEKVWTWPTSPPEAQGLDAKALAEAADVIRAGVLYPKVHALLVIRHGVLAFEEYFNGAKVEGLHTLQSVTKSFTSALIGIALARGEIKSLDERVLDFFPDLDGIANLDDRKRSIRIRDLLTMRSGTDYQESGPASPHEQLNRLFRGWDKFYLDRPMVQPPGTGFQYDSGGVILLSAILKSRTGLHADAYAAKHLFPALNITRWYWHRNAEGHAHAGGGLSLTARDMAKLGQLYLDKGRWGGVQVLPASWIEESFRMHVDLTQQGQPPFGYGYLWWIGAPDPKGAGREMVSFARGRFGQYIFVVPEHDMVVAIQAQIQPGIEQSKLMQLFYDRILPVVRR